MKFKVGDYIRLAPGVKVGAAKDLTSPRLITKIDYNIKNETGPKYYSGQVLLMCANSRLEGECIKVAYINTKLGKILYK